MVSDELLRGHFVSDAINITTRTLRILTGAMVYGELGLLMGRHGRERT